MSKIITSSVVDTVVAGATAPTRTLPVLNINSDYRKKLLRANSNEVQLINTTTNLEESEMIRICQAPVANIFAKGGVTPVSPLTPKEGTSLLVQLARDVKITDSSDSANSYIAPMSVQLVVKVPKSEAVTDDIVAALIDRLYSVLYYNNKLQINTLLKGAIDPKGL